VLIGASLSEPHISVTSLPTRVYAWTDHLLYVTSSIYFVRFASCVNLKRTPGVEDMKQFKHDSTTSLMVTSRMETTHRLTYSLARVVEVTSWQSFSAVCHCCLTHGSCHWTQISSGYSDGGYDGLSVSICSCHSTWCAVCSK